MMNHKQYDQVFHAHDANAAGGEYVDIDGTPQIPYAADPGGSSPAKAPAKKPAKPPAKPPAKNK
jgi:hypothetical protein